MKSRSVRTHVLSMLSAAALAVLPIMTGCGDTAPANGNDGGGGDDSGVGGGGGGGGGGGDARVEDPLYAVFATTFTPDFRQATSAFLHIVPSLEAGTEINDEKAIEFTAHGVIFGLEKSKEFYVTLHDTGGVAKFVLEDDGTATRAEEIGFNAFGINTLFNPPVGVASPTRAYVFDPTTLQLVAFDPSSMTIVGEPQKLTEMAEEGFGVFAERFMTRIEDKLYFAFGNFNLASLAVSSKAGIVVIDTANNSAKVVVDDRCSLYYYTHLAADGMLYTGSYPTLAAINALDETSPTACIARFDPKTDTFDAGFKAVIKDLTGGLNGAGLVPSAGNSAYIKVYNPANLEMTPTEVRAATGSLAWELWKVDMTNLTPNSAMKVDVPPSTSSLSIATVDGKTYSAAVKDSEQNSVLIDMSADPPKEGIRTHGIPFSALRVR